MDDHTVDAIITNARNAVSYLEETITAERQAHAATKAELDRDQARLDALDTSGLVEAHASWHQGDNVFGRKHWRLRILGETQRLNAIGIRDAADQLIARQEAKDAKG